MRTIRPIKRGKDSREGGFTLLELVIVVLVISIAAMAAIPNLAASEVDATLYAACAEVMTALEYAQMNAMTGGQMYRVTIDATTDTLTVDNNVCSRLSEILDTSNSTVAASHVESSSGYSTAKKSLNELYSGSFASETVFSGVNITASSFGSGSPVVFDGHGKPSAGGTVTLSYGGRQAVVSLNAATGKVTRTQ